MINRIVLTVTLALLIFLAGFFHVRSSLAKGGKDGLATGQIFYQANAAYKEAKFDKAIENYEKLIQSGKVSGNLYYNLGNSFFKKGEFGKAIVNYERARFFIPHDSDVRANYEYTLSLLKVRSPSFANLLEKAANRLFEGVTVNFLTMVLSLIYSILFLVLILNLFLKGLRKFTIAFIVMLAISLVLSVVSLYSKISDFNKGAIIITKEANVKFEPLESATTYFTLTEGSKVAVIEKAENWYKIKRSDKKIGWLNRAHLELLRD